MTDLPEEHPSYRCVEITRVSGGSSKLFGSKAPHNHRIQLRIRKATRRDNLEGRPHHPKTGEVVEIEMSHHQFGRLLTCMNRGGGIPCTITRLNGEIVEDPPATDREEKYKIRAEDKVEEILEDMDEFEEVFQEALDPTEGGYVGKSTRQKLLKKLRLLRQEVNANLPHLLCSLQEQIEETIQEAQADIDAYMNRSRNAIHGFAKKLGLEDEANRLLD